MTPKNNQKNIGEKTNILACFAPSIDVKPMKQAIQGGNGGNQSSDDVSCQDFTDVICSGTTCTSAQIRAVNWIE